MKALIAAGPSQHLRPFTHIKNKHLLELAGKPLIAHAVKAVRKSGIHDIGIVVGEDDTEIEQYLGNGEAWDASLTYIPQHGGPLGIAHAIYSAQEFLGDDPFLLYLGDNIILDDLSEIKKRFEESKANSLLTLARVANPERFGVPEFDNQGRIMQVEERPVKPKSPFAVAGLYFYDHNVHKAFPHIKPSFRGNYEISDLHTWLARNHYSVDWAEIKRWWKDRGSPTDLLEGNVLALSHIEGENKGTVENSVTLQGEVRIGTGTKIGGRTVVRGPVVIGDHCLVKDSYIGPHTSVGSNVEVHNADIEHSIVYDGVSINTRRKIIESIIGENSIISNAEYETPQGTRLITGDNSTFSI